MTHFADPIIKERCDSEHDRRRNREIRRGKCVAWKRNGALVTPSRGRHKNSRRRLRPFDFHPDLSGEVPLILSVGENGTTTTSVVSLNAALKAVQTVLAGSWTQTRRLRFRFRSVFVEEEGRSYRRPLKSGTKKRQCFFDFIIFRFKGTLSLRRDTSTLFLLRLFSRDCSAFERLKGRVSDDFFSYVTQNYATFLTLCGWGSARGISLHIKGPWPCSQLRVALAHRARMVTSTSLRS